MASQSVKLYRLLGALLYHHSKQIPQLRSAFTKNFSVIVLPVFVRVLERAFPAELGIFPSQRQLLANPCEPFAVLCSTSQAARQLLRRQLRFPSPAAASAHLQPSEVPVSPMN